MFRIPTYSRSFSHSSVTPAQAGVHNHKPWEYIDSRLRGSDDERLNALLFAPLRESILTFRCVRTAGIWVHAKAQRRKEYKFMLLINLVDRNAYVFSDICDKSGSFRFVLRISQNSHVICLFNFFEEIDILTG
jgi:hypothetical protein